MLQSYEAIYDHGKMLWLGDRPGDDGVRVIVTVLPNNATSVSKEAHQPSTRIAKQGKVLGDIISPAASLADWNCEK